MIIKTLVTFSALAAILTAAAMAISACLTMASPDYKEFPESIVVSVQRGRFDLDASIESGDPPWIDSATHPDGDWVRFQKSRSIPFLMACQWGHVIGRGSSGGTGIVPGVLHYTFSVSVPFLTLAALLALPAVLGALRRRRRSRNAASQPEDDNIRKPQYPTTPGLLRGVPIVLCAAAAGATLFLGGFIYALSPAPGQDRCGCSTALYVDASYADFSGGMELPSWAIEPIPRREFSRMNPTSTRRDFNVPGIEELGWVSGRCDGEPIEPNVRAGPILNTHRYRRLDFTIGPLILLTAFSLAPATWLLHAILRRRRWRRRGLCRKCLYDLRGSTSGICPECGTPFEAPGPMQP